VKMRIVCALILGALMTVRPPLPPAAASESKPEPGAFSPAEAASHSLSDSTALDALRRAAMAASESAQDEQDTGVEETAFTSGALGLQALNPEISITGDFLASYRSRSHVTTPHQQTFRGLGVHVESYLDPFSRFKAAVSANEEGMELGEAYFTRFALLPGMNLTLGKFRQQFGVINRWHKHALDQVDFPLPLRQIFGPGGLNQTGLSLDIQLPVLAGAAQEATLQVTNGQNPSLFSGNTENVPSLLLHLKHYRDLSKDVYLEIGATSMAGRNDTWTVTGPGGVPVQDTADLWLSVWGGDLTLLWEPTDRMRYRNLSWHTEAFLLEKRILSPDGTGPTRLECWGFTSLLESKLSRSWEAGLRLDYFQPDTQPASGTEEISLAPLALAAPEPRQVLSALSITWYQSPWVHWRVEWDHLAQHDLGPDDDTFWFQCVFAAGPHKHERY
jgi:hypothetical protein